MSKRLFIGLAALVAVIFAIILLAGVKSRPASYQGKSVEAWARRADAGDGNATAAFQAMGTNAIPELIDLLERNDSSLKRRAWALRRRIPWPFRRYARDLSPGETATVRSGAIKALGIIGPDAKDAVPALGRVLHGSSHQEKWDAGVSLGKIGKYSLPVLLDAVRDADPDIRRSAASALAQIGPQAKEVAPVQALLLLDSDPMVRQSARYGLQTVGAPEIKALGEVIQNGDDNARDAAVQALLAMVRSLRQAEPGLVKMAQAENPAIRRQALEALGAMRVPDNATIKALTQALSDPVLEVRLAAAQALSNVSARAQPAVPALIICLDDPSVELRQSAARTLGMIGTAARSAAPKLKTLLNDTDGSVQAAAKEALGRLGGE